MTLFQWDRRTIKFLSDNGYAYEKIYVIAHINGAFSISISEIKISLGKEYAEKEGEVTDLLCERFGAKVNITFKEQ